MILRSSEYKARKDHRCDWCGGKIPAGQRYSNGFCIWEGDPNPWKAHLDCEALAQKHEYISDGIGPFYDWDKLDLPEEDWPEFARLLKRAGSDPKQWGLI